MITNYLIYLYTLPKDEQVMQIAIFIIFFLILFVICFFLDSKFFDKDKNDDDDKI